MLYQQKMIRGKEVQKMKVSELLDCLALEIVAGRSGLDKEITGGFTGDLLSLVLAHAQEKSAWITVQGHENAVAVAVMIGLSAIILTQGIEPNERMCQKADEEGIPILKTKLNSYEMSIALGGLL